MRAVKMLALDDLVSIAIISPQETYREHKNQIAAMALISSSERLVRVGGLSFHTFHLTMETCSSFAACNRPSLLAIREARCVYSIMKGLFVGLAFKFALYND